MRIIVYKEQQTKTINIMNVSEFIIVTSKESDHGYSVIRPQIVCNDGFKMSVQAGKGSYSTPRGLSKGCTSVEIGFPSIEEELINEYAEGGDYTETVYPFTPIEVAEKVIEKHGGINISETFAGY